MNQVQIDWVAPNDVSYVFGNGEATLDVQMATVVAQSDTLFSYWPAYDEGNKWILYYFQVRFDYHEAITYLIQLVTSSAYLLHCTY